MTSSKIISSSKDIEYKIFNQQQYNNNFFYCDKDHPFIAFTTCFCPLCEKIEEIKVAINEQYDTDTELDNLAAKYCELKFRVKKHAPELLI